MTLMDWTIIASAVFLTGTIVVSWIAGYRAPKARTFGSSKWFALPVWAQISLGIIAVLLFIFIGYTSWIPLPLSVPAGVLNILRLVGLILFLGGTLLVLWARWTLGEMYGVSTSSAVQLKRQHRLVQDGPYAYVRHPLYLGIWLIFLGVALIYRMWAPLLFFLLFLFSLYRRARREEAALAATFGEEWHKYAARVPAFLPGLRGRGVEEREG